MARRSVPPRRAAIRAAVPLAVVVLAATACAGSGDDGDGAGTGAVTAPPPTLVPPRTDPGATGDAAGASTTTAPLDPSEEADLPDAPPPSGGGTTSTTTIAGPLPEPAIALAPIGDFDHPVEVESRPGDDRIFVVEQPGRVVAVSDLDTEVVLDITGETSGGGEQGLLGLSFHPEQELAYVDYTDRNGDTVVAEYVVDPVTAVFDPESARTVLTIDQPFGNHNGGELDFGPDGYLYIGVGDGGSAGDPQRNGLDLSTRLGKILRIDPIPSGDAAFTVPPDNPFVDVDGADPTIWSYGLRNPWRFSFDPATGDLWIADVGQNAQEEIDHAPAAEGRSAGRGLGFGWSAFEGTLRFNDDQPTDGHTPPVVVYGHDGGHCSVSGGAVYRGTLVPDLSGWYVFADYCSGTIWGYDPTSGPEPRVIVLGTSTSPAAIAAGGDDELYVVSNAGTVSRIAPA
jgi:glucose/arabinose dehydrogenase